MRHPGVFIAVLLLSVLGLGLGCGGGSIPIPYLVDQRFELLDECVTDFSAEEGTCLRIHPDGTVDEDCQKSEKTCVGHFYITTRRGLPLFVHINAAYPCYPDWLIQRYSDPESKWHHHPDYRVVSLELTNYVTNEIVHLIEILKQPQLQSNQTCYYRLEAGIDDMIRGEYGLKLWTPERTPILETTFRR